MMLLLQVSQTEIVKEGSAERSFEVTEIGKCAVVGSVPNARRYYTPRYVSWTFFAD